MSSIALHACSVLLKINSDYTLMRVIFCPGINILNFFFFFPFFSPTRFPFSVFRVHFPLHSLSPERSQRDERSLSLQRNISISTAGRDCHRAETDKRNKPQSLWDEREWELMSRLLAFPQILGSHRLYVLFVRPPTPRRLTGISVGMTEEVHWLTCKQSQTSCSDNKSFNNRPKKEEHSMHFEFTSCTCPKNKAHYLL